jgi:hypothetical protein
MSDREMNAVQEEESPVKKSKAAANSKAKDGVLAGAPLTVRIVGQPTVIQQQTGNAVLATVVLNTLANVTGLGGQVMSLDNMPLASIAFPSPPTQLASNGVSSNIDSTVNPSPYVVVVTARQGTGVAMDCQETSS